MLKRIYKFDKETDYLVSDEGEIYSEKTRKFLKGDKNSGYHRVLLIINGGKYRFPVHALVGEAFIPNPTNLPILHHKNNNSLDNRVENLEWISYSDNCLAKNKTHHSQIEETFSEEELTLEQWRRFRDTHYYFSSLGRTYNAKTEKVVKGHINIKLGYKRDTLCLGEQRITLPRHRLVYESFHPNEKLDIINHKNGVRWDNRLSNLENVSASENLNKAINETHTRKVRHCMFKKEEEELLFFSIAEAARYFSKNEAQVRQAINNNRYFLGYACCELTEEDYQNMLLVQRLSERSKEIEVKS